MSLTIAASSSAPLLSGLAFGLALMLSLGPQNTHLIRQGLSRNFALTTATTGYFSDVALVLASLAGFGAALAAEPQLVRWLGWVGAGFLAFCGARGLIAAASARCAVPAATREPTRARAAATMLAMTWANPLYYAEVLIPFGLLSTRFGGARGAELFAVGMLAASFVRFYGYSFAAGKLSGFFERPAAMRAFEMGAGALLLILAVCAATAMCEGGAVVLAQS
jgi:L-lysine exporter family protein LysE/ArgO